MMLADMGADVLLVDRPSDPHLGLGRERWYDVMMRGRRSVTLDLKSPDGVDAALLLAQKADALIEGFRPGRDGAPRPRSRRRCSREPEARLRPHDRLGPGRAARAARRPRHQLHRALRRAARDRARAATRRCRRSTSSATSAAAACCSRSASPARCSRRGAPGKGQVVDAAMVEGASLLAAMFAGHAARRHVERGARRQRPRLRRALVRHVRDEGRQVRRDRRDRAEVLRGAARTARPRGRRPAGAARPRGLAGAARGASPRCSARRRATNGARCSRARTRASRRCWRSRRRATHPHNVARGGHVTVGGVAQPAPAPRFSRTPGAVRRAPPERGERGARRWPTGASPTPRSTGSRRSGSGSHDRGTNHARPHRPCSARARHRARRRRRRRAGLAGAAGPPDRPVSARRGHRRHGAGARRQALGGVQAAGAGGEPDRWRGRDRHYRGCPRRARRLHAASHRRPGHHAAPRRQVAAVRHRARLRAGDPGDHPAGHDRGASFGAGDHDPGVHRARESEPGQVLLRALRHRLRPAHVGRAVQAPRRHRHRGHPLSAAARPR